MLIESIFIKFKFVFEFQYENINQVGLYKINEPDVLHVLTTNTFPLLPLLFQPKKAREQPPPATHCHLQTSTAPPFLHQ